ncbi:MAG: hypothetical protein GEU78_03700 [Actinobacteria bacterium]|nr:hypothetical protein [Actinomycetota bacterium]
MGAELPNASVRDWFDRRTIGAVERSIDDLTSAKRRRATSISVCLPTLNEAPTVGDICTIIGRELLEPGLVDELIVCDTGSQDGTMEVARRAGARAVSAGVKIPDLPAAMLQFEGGRAQIHRVEVTEFPPLREVSA